MINDTQAILLHDIRNQLSAIAALIQLIEMDPKEPDNGTYARKALAAIWKIDEGLKQITANHLRCSNCPIPDGKRATDHM